MNIDRYTKCVLTVIAACLVWLCFMSGGSPLQAQPRFGTLPNATVQPVVIVGTGTLDQAGTVTINYVESGRRVATDPTIPVALPYSSAKPLPVALPYSIGSPMPAMLTNSSGDPVPVEISSVKKAGGWEPLRVSVEDAPVRKTPGNGSQ
jgi:hypothetical protein